ncbi:MAG: pyridoxamine 5'-phosphate oxidase family protein [Solobacterium sp.]|nr:pyridoxamine 5'-phosphate oxidase family protein [Solobacterium sp.]
MFREMRRSKQQLPEEECIRILTEGKRGVLSVLGDDEYPYGIPVDYLYSKEDGCLYFHGAPAGHKIDAVNRHDKVSFVVFDNEEHKEGDWAPWIRSVVVFGRIRIIEDTDKRLDIVRRIGLKYYPTVDEVEEELAAAGHRVAALELTIEHMSGKLVHEK